MHESLHISAYTPSNTEPEILEKMFVQREVLLSQTVKWCEESIVTKKKNHLIFVGPRGSGKTHFISMTVNRLKEKAKTDKNLNEKLIVVWLGEDDVITNFIDLVLSILETLVRNHPNDFNKDCLKDAKGEKQDKAADIILHSITQQIEGKTILLVKENMSDVFDGLKDNGQKKFRAYLQEQRNISILATSQQLFEGVSSRDNAFFGFFDVHHLETLSVEQARQLIKNIAVINGDTELADFLDSPEGNYRIRALHHLAGGNHRLYVELAAFLTMESLDDFVSALSKLADNLTPYFQERVKSLPPQQGKIVQKLCELEGATPVKTIAEETFIGERSVAKQLGDLAKKGYVISHKRGKQSYYEMAEPLMRLSLEVKNNHGQPLKIVASLLRVWFSEAELSDKQSDEFLFKYQEAALSIGNEIFTVLNSEIDKQTNEAMKKCDFKTVIDRSSEILEAKCSSISVEEQSNYYQSRMLAYFFGLSLEDAEKDYNEALNLSKEYGEPSISFKNFEKAIHTSKDNTMSYIHIVLSMLVKSEISYWENWISHIFSKTREPKFLLDIGFAIFIFSSEFINNKLLHSSFSKWCDLWKKYGSQYPETEAGFGFLDAPLKAIELQNDKPLLALPKEIRDILMPLINEDAFK